MFPTKGDFALGEMGNERKGIRVGVGGGSLLYDSTVIGY